MSERTKHEILEDQYTKAMKKQEKLHSELEEVEIQIEILEKELYGTSSLDAYLEGKEKEQEAKTEEEEEEKR